jgi:XRE family transcriptional regulator, regulator of sulfur utilization
VEKERAEAVMSDVGARIAEVRRDRGWTQQEAADRLRIEVQSMQRIERGGSNLTIRTLVKIANCLGVRTKSLFDEPTARERRPGRPSRQGP